MYVTGLAPVVLTRAVLRERVLPGHRGPAGEPQASGESGSPVNRQRRSGVGLLASPGKPRPRALDRELQESGPELVTRSRQLPAMHATKGVPLVPTHLVTIHLLLPGGPRFGGGGGLGLLGSP